MKTLGELKDFLSTLSEEQLNQKFVIQDETNVFELGYWDIIEEDHINPSGDGCEPISIYKENVEEWEEHYKDEPICLKKDDVIFFIA